MTATHTASPIDAPLAEIDPEINALIRGELERQRDQIELIASENFTSRAVLEATGSVLTNKYAEGYPHKRYYGGCERVDEVEELAISRANSLFGSEFANVQPHSGSQANMGAYFSVLNAGDTVLAMSLAHGGHLTHGHGVNFSGKLFNFVHYGVHESTGYIDYESMLELAKKHRPKLIVAGGSAYAREIDFAKFRAAADEVGALFMVDMAHFAGLVAAGVHPSPVPHAHIVTSTTHKTLRGPRSGLILATEEIGARINKSVFPGMQGGPLCHVVAAKAVCFAQAATAEFRTYSQQVVTNAKALGEALTDGGWGLVSGGTDTHLILADLRPIKWTGKDAEERLDLVHITANRNAVPFDDKPPMITSGIRAGTPAMTTRGFGEEDMRETGRIMVEALRDDADLDSLTGRAKALLAAHPLYPDLDKGYA